MRWIVILILCLLAAGCTGVDTCHCGGRRCTCVHADGACVIIRQPDGSVWCFGR